MNDKETSISSETLKKQLFKIFLDNIEENLNNFEKIKVSTKTYTASTNIDFDLKQLFECLDVTSYHIVPKKRGRRPKDIDKDICEQKLEKGSIISLKWENKLKGCQLKTKNKKTFFRNSVSVVMFVDKLVNCKVCRSGNFQFTGCRNWDHAIECIKELWKRTKDKIGVYTFNNGDTLKATIVPAMRNIDFNLGFNIDRANLNDYIIKYHQSIKKNTCNEKYQENEEEDNTRRDSVACTKKISLDRINSLLETSFGYTGVSIKIPLRHEKRMNMYIKTMLYENDQWNYGWMTYHEYLNTLPSKIRNKKLNETKYNTFLVFHSGKVIFSGLTSDLMKDTYYTFIDIIKNGFEEIVEILEK